MSLCQTCGDTGYVFTRHAGRAFPDIHYWIFHRCTCDAGSPGSWRVTVGGKAETVSGIRKWDRAMKTFAERGIPRDEVFSLARRLEAEQAEFQAALKNA